jgi:hypothetical protein
MLRGGGNVAQPARTAAIAASGESRKDRAIRFRISGCVPEARPKLKPARSGVRHLKIAIFRASFRHINDARA